MRKRSRLIGGTAMAVMAISAFTAAASHSKSSAHADDDDDDMDNGAFPRCFSAELFGDNEVPRPVMTDTTGEFEIRFNRDFTEGEFELEVRDGIQITQAHIHCAPEGQNGDIVVFLAGLVPGGHNVDGTWINNASITGANIIDGDCGLTLEELAMEMANGNTYVNVHSVANPGGEIRGQIVACDDGDSDSSDSDSG